MIVRGVDTDGGSIGSDRYTEVYAIQIRICNGLPTSRIL